MKYILLFAATILFGQTFAQNNWTATAGPFGGAVSALKRSTSGTLYAVINQRLYQSTNNGDAWALTPTTSPSQLTINDVMIDTDGKMYAVNFSVLYKSEDNGITWTTVSTNAFQSVVKVQRIGPDGVFVVWGYNGVYVSINKGVSWVQISSLGFAGLQGLTANSAGDIFYAANNGKLFRHLYQGLTANWTSTNFIQTTFSIPTNEFVASMTFDNAGNLYIAALNEFFKSTNNGGSFSSIKANLAPLNYFYGILATSSDNSIYFFANDNKVYKSTNAGVNWSSANGPSFDYGATVNSIVFSSASTFFVGTNGDGVFRTTNTGTSWDFKSAGLTNANTIGLVVANTTNRILAIKNGRSYWSSSDGGATWTINVLSDFVNGILKLTDGTILMYGSRVFRSTNNGLSFTSSSSYFNHSKIVEAANGDLYGFKYGKIDRSTDKGVTWTDLTITGLPTTFSPYEAAIDGTTNIICHGWDGVSANRTYKIVGTTATELVTPYASGYNNVFFLNNKFYLTQFSAYYVTSDLGTTFTTVGFSGNAVFPLKNASFSGIAVSKNGSLQITQDDGGTWNNTTLPNTSAYITDVAVDGAGDYYASAFGSSVLKFTNELLVNPATLPPYIPFNWQPLNGPYGGTISRVKAHPDGSTLFAIANGNTIWRYSSGVWTRLSPIATSTIYYDVDIDAAGNVYFISLLNPQQKIYKSTDKGNTWAQLTSTNLPASNSAIRRIEFLSDGSMLALGAFGGFGRIYKSIDGGATFTQKFVSTINTNYAGTTTNPRIPIESGNVVATTGTLPREGLVISLDKGETWTAKPFPNSIISSNPTESPFVGSIAFDGTTILATTIVNSSVPNWVTNLVKSTDNGTTWSIISTPGPVTNLSFGKRFVVLPGGEYLLTLQNPFFDCYRSTDKGATWISNGNFGDIYVFSDAMGSTAYLMGNVKGVQRTTDGGLTITQFNEGMPINTASDIEIIDGKDLIVGATSPYHSTNFGSSFSLATGQVAGNFLTTPDGIIAYGSRRLQKSIDNGKTYTEIGADRYFSFLTLSKTGSAYWAYSGTEITGSTVQSGLFNSTDLINWTKAPISGLPPEGSFSVGGMIIDDADRVYMLTFDNNTGQSKIYKIVFGAATDITEAIGAADPSSILYFNNQIYLYDGQGIIFKSNDGEVWTQSSAPSGASLVTTNGYLFVTNFDPVLWLSRDNGSSWQSVGDVPQPGVSFRDVAINPFDGYAYATLSNSVVRKSANVVIPNDNTKPVVTTLLPAHNAVNVALRPPITITFDEITNAVAGKKLRIFDLAQPALPVLILDMNEAVRSTEKSWDFSIPADLNPLKTYFVIVDAGAFADIFGNTFIGITTNTAWRFTTRDIQKPTIVLVTTDLKYSKGASSKKIDITVTDNINLPTDKTKIYYRGITKLDSEPFIPATLSVLTGGGTVSTTFTIEAQENWYDEMGLEFYFEAEDAVGNMERSPSTPGTYHYSYITYPSSESPVIPSARIQAGGKEINYRMISVPFQLEDEQTLTIFNELGPVDKRNWRMFTYAGNDQFTENPPAITRGKGYWINVKESPGEVKVEGATTPTNNRTSFFKMNLAAGWNQIGNPYPVEIDWDEIRTANTAIKRLKIFNGTGYVEESTLLPYQGAFVFVDGTSAVSNLVVRFKGITTGGRIAATKDGTDLSKPNWVIPISATSNEIVNSLGGIGMNKIALPDWDQFDDINPPRFMSYAELAFNKKHTTYNLAKDIVPTQDEYIWYFNVNASDAQVQLTWDNTAIKGEQDLLLFDVIGQKLINMKETGTHSFYPKNENSFQIHFGKDLIDKIKPTAITLGNPYPNPANDDAIIEFTLPESKSAYAVQLEVYNSVGQRAALLVNQNLLAGFYSTRWNTENHKGGLYFYRLTVTASGNHRVLTKKIIINR